MISDQTIKFSLFAMTSILGWLSFIVIPDLISIEQSSIHSLIAFTLIIITGFILGFIKPDEKPWFWAIASILFLPVVSISEGIVDPQSHNLLPFEFIFSYPVIGIFPLLGAFAGIRLRRKFQN